MDSKLGRTFSVPVTLLNAIIAERSYDLEPNSESTTCPYKGLINTSCRFLPVIESFAILTHTRSALPVSMIPVHVFSGKKVAVFTIDLELINARSGYTATSILSLCHRFKVLWIDASLIKTKVVDN